MKNLNFLKTFEMYNPDDKKGIIDQFDHMIKSVNACPFTKHLLTNALTIKQIFILHGKEKSKEILDRLYVLQMELRENFSEENDYQKYLEPKPNGLYWEPAAEYEVIVNLLKEQGWEN